MARPTRLTKKVREAIYRGIRTGLSYDRAAQLAGINPRTFYIWKKKGIEKKAPVYIQFLHELKKAEIEGEAAALQRIIQAATPTDDKPGQWQAAAWYLERRFPDRWSRVQKLEVTWQSEIINLVQTGVVTIDDVREDLGDELAQELFASADIRTSQS